MKNYRNTFALILISTSILLLLVLQFFWIKSAYSNALDNLKKETNSTFRTTVFLMRDSVMQKTFETISPDSAMHLVLRRRAMMDSLRPNEGPGESDERRVLFRKLPPSEISSVVVTNDTIRVKTTNDFKDRRDFIFRFAPDSLKTDSIAVHFKRAMDAAGIDLPFKIIHFRRGGEKRVLPANSFLSEPVRMSPFSRYAVIVSDLRAKLIREILPQAAFSVFLTLLTLISFYVLYRSIRSQEKLVELKNDFISNVTHELKTPITTVSVAIEALRNFNGLNNPALVEEYLGIAQNELARLSILTDKVLKTAIYEDKGVSFRMEKTDIGKLIEQVLVSLRLILEKNNATAVFEKSGSDFSFSGDNDHLINVIYNLLDNAIKYSPVPALLTILLKETSDQLILTIADNGRGIPHEYRKKVFEKFFRVPTGDIHNIKGYGLGLSYVKAVVESHQGTIEVKNNEPAGSCFIITLPKNKTA